MGSKKMVRRILGVGAVVVAFTAGAGAAVTAQSSGSNEGSAQPTPAPRAGAASPTETVYVPIVPCRLFSSVPTAPGKFAPGTTRSINKGGDLSTQGGKAGGCGIPNGATALEVNITAPLAEGNGYIRVWPDESVEQGSTFMNFSNAFNVSNAGTVDVDKGATDVMDLKVYNARTHVIIDVLGYYMDDLFAVVNANGTLVRGNGVVSVSKIGGFNGSYDVRFDRDVTGCAYNVTLGVDGNPPHGSTVAAPRSGAATGVFVETKDTPTGTLTDRAFHLTVDC